MPRDVDAAIDLLHTQWDRLRDWIPAIVDDQEPSVLDGWTVADLVAHVGRSLSLTAGIIAAPEGTLPVSLGAYVGQYPSRAGEIAEGSRRLAAEIAEDPLAAIDSIAAEAFARLDELKGAEVVIPPSRPPLRLADIITTRLLELVVHADDLERSVDLPGASPVEDDALDLVANELLQIVVARGGWSLEVAEPLLWVRLACGRVRYDVDLVAAALRPTYASDSVPDLELELPLL